MQRDGTPNGWHVLEIDGVEATVRFQAAGHPADHQMRIVFDTTHHGNRDVLRRDFRHGELLDGRMSVDAVAAAAIFVNVFDGGPKTQVSFSVAGRPPVEMTRVDQLDPFVQESFQRNRDTIKSWIQPSASSHLWTADLPDDLGPGTYTVTVDVVDEFGRGHHGHRVLEITGTSANPVGEARFE